VKLRERSQTAIGRARDVIARLGVRGPRDLVDIELVASALGAYVLFCEVHGNEEGSLLHSGRSSIIRVRASLRETPKGRFVIAHEMGHHEMHAHVDHFALCTTEALSLGGSRWRVEAEASDFGGELVVPTRFAEDQCRSIARPMLAHVLAVASRFGVSFTTAALRFLDMTDAPCAFVETRAGRVKRGSATTAFRGHCIRGRVFETPKGAVAESLPVEGSDVVLTWLSQESSA
jgi:hypothetical protein